MSWFAAAIVTALALVAAARGSQLPTTESGAAPDGAGLPVAWQVDATVATRPPPVAVVAAPADWPAGFARPPTTAGLDVPTAASTVGTSPASIEELPSALDQPQLATATAKPIGVHLPTIGIDDAPVTPVGVEANGEMEIPGADEVGWYRFGPSPGDEGSAVLAAHIAFDGTDGVFRDLSDLEPGDRFDVLLDDGDALAFEVVGLGHYEKAELPSDEIFSHSGLSRLVLITCGGAFNQSLRSYDSNVVAYAVPVVGA